MDVFKVISLLLFTSYYCKGHFIFGNYDNYNRRPPAYPSLNFQTFPEYFKPTYRIRYQTSNRNRIQPHTPNPIMIPNTKKQEVSSEQKLTNTKKDVAPPNHGNGMLSLIKNAMKPLTEKTKNRREMTEKPMKSLRGSMYEHERNGAHHLKFLPMQIKKEIAKQLRIIFTKMSIEKGKINTKQEINKTKESKVEAIDITNNSAEHVKLNETSLDKTKTLYINKMEAKSMFGNFVGNKHFVNIFIFNPNKDNSAEVVGLKGNMTAVFTENPVEISTKNPKDQLIDKTTDKGIEESLVTKNDDYNLNGNKDDKTSLDNSDNTAITTEVTVTTNNILTSDITLSTAGTTKKQDKDKKDTENDIDDLSSYKDNVDEVAEDNDLKTTENFPLTSTLTSTNTELHEVTESPSKNETEESNDKRDEASTVALSIEANRVTESSSEIVTEGQNDKKDEESTVAPSTIANKETESSSENLIEEPNDKQDEGSTVAPSTSTNELTDNPSENSIEEPDDKHDDSSSVAPSIAPDKEIESSSENLTEEENGNKDERSTVTPSTETNEFSGATSESLSDEPNDKEHEKSTVASSTVTNEVTATSNKNLMDIKDENVDDQDSNEFIENDEDSTVASTAVVTQGTENTFENLTEKLNELKDETVEEDIHDQVKGESTGFPEESTVTIDTKSVASVIKDNNVTTTEISTTTDRQTEATTNSESNIKGPSDNVMESTTYDLNETLSTRDESTTESVDYTIEYDNSGEGMTDDEYIEIEYTYF